mmetsp:Transcript_19853/g.24228  ORF Transcript_19853/g.24228 Transcript_19853/m.24228 type:complete len:96 (-) Transcript_19853:126-413(-)
MNDLADLAIKLAGKDGKLAHKHVPGPEGVRGRNSDNTLIKQVLGWAPSITLEDGFERTMKWIQTQIDAKKEAGVEEDYSTSKVVVQTTESLDALS